jgi:hypothetical protein
MRFSSLIKPALLIMAMALPASHAASATPLGGVAAAIAASPQIEKVHCYRHRGYYSGYYGDRGNRYYRGYRRQRDYGYDGYRPSYRSYSHSYRPRYYREYGGY